MFPVPHFFVLLHGLAYHAVETVLGKIMATRYSVARALDSIGAGLVTSY